MEILAKCSNSTLLYIWGLDYYEIKNIIDSQKKLNGLLSDNPKFTISYKISGKVLRYILDERFSYNLFEDNLILFIDHYCVPIDKVIECIRCRDLNLIVDPYLEEISFKSYFNDTNIVETSYESRIENLYKYFREL